MKRIDITGEKFGRLTALKMVYEPGKDSMVECRCDCGNVTTKLVYNLRSGNTKSCGCLALEHNSEQGKRVIQKMIAARRRHGMSKTPTYAAWRDAKNRCCRTQDSHYHLYGGRGIRMCQEWLDSFAAFLHDMGECPPGMTLDRIDVNGNYEPGNCRWLSMAEQSRNTRRNVATWESVRLIRAAYKAGESGPSLARRFKMSKSNVYMITSRHTWPESERPHA